MMRWAWIVTVSVLFAAAAMGENDGTIEVRRDMLSRNNELRAKRGLAPHRENAALMAAAQDHASYMAKTRSRSHYSNGGPSSRAARYGFQSGVRENIAWGQSTADSAFATWYGSSGHHSNMMSFTTDAGFGWSIGGDGVPCWVAVYGTPPAEPSESDPRETAAPSVSQETYSPRRSFFGWLFRR